MSIFAKPTARRNQSGVALLTVLLVVALTSLLATQSLRVSHSALNNDRSALQAKQAYWYARGAEQLALHMLAEDRKLSRSEPVDSLMDNWAGDFSKFRPDNGEMLMRVYDQHALFNVNTLLNSDTDARGHFTALASGLGISSSKIRALISQFDSKALPTQASAENAVFGGGALAEVSLLKSFGILSAEEYLRLVPYLTALPALDTSVNPNTAKEALLFAMAGSDGAQSVRKIINMRNTRPYTNAEAALFQSISGASTTLNVSSEYFQIQLAARFQDRWFYLASLVHRDKQGNLQVVHRIEGKAAVSSLMEELKILESA